MESGQPRIDGERLWGRLMAIAKHGATVKGGVCRLALSDEDRAGRNLFARWAQEAGCTVTVDTMGNMFARRPGSDPSALPVGSGSHLDSQPTGGKFDGVLGVLAALEVIETLNDHGIRTQCPIEAVVWTNEEGARFTPAMIGSGVFSGEFDLEYAYSREDGDGLTLGEELKRIGYLGSQECGDHRFRSHFELHIEQGPILENEDIAIGVVTGVQGIRWYEVKVAGVETHAGPSPMRLRSDPVPIAAGIIPEIYALAEREGEDARCTIGVLEASPGSTNTVPGTVTFTVDLRHPDALVLGRMNQALHDLLGGYQAGNCEIGFQEIWYSPPVAFDDACVAAVNESARELGLVRRSMVSGAGHDSVYISRVAPAGMIFIPCEDGISHNEAESTTPEQVAQGANVLLGAILRMAEPTP